jgi:RimJ/RimL family protein N-acetyltransferase
MSTEVDSSKFKEEIETARLALRKPQLADAEAIFSRFAADPEVTRYMSWPRHRSLDDTRAFLDFSDAEWMAGPAGPYLIFSRETGQLLGSTGLSFKSPSQALTGYVLARDAWGNGFATESLHAMVELARELGVHQLEAVCHIEHRASAHVMEKCGFVCKGVERVHTEFPNLSPGIRTDVWHYVRNF